MTTREQLAPILAEFRSVFGCTATEVKWLADKILAVAPPEPTEGQPANSVDFQQRRGMALDVIDEALETYRGFMLDDDYEPQDTLDKIMKRMDERSAALRAMPMQDHGWQDISTAPRTMGVHRGEADIDLWHKRQGRLADCFWSKDDSPNRKGAWFSRSGGRAFNMGTDDAFSHWMPKPAAPAMVADEGTKP